MMLQALVEYAERKGLGDADFAGADVRWEIPLDTKGKLCGGPIALSEDASAKKPLPKKMLRPYTSPNELNQGDKSHFLCDTLERCVQMLDAKSSPARRVQHGYFKALLEETAKAVPEAQPQLAAVVTFLNDEEAIAGLHTQLIKGKAKVSDNAIFTVDGINLLQHNGIKQFWRERRKSANASTARSQRVCIATGELAETLDTTEKITGVPGGLAMGTNLISFDKDAFCSYGLEQAQNAALSAPAELKIRSALNTLIQCSKAQRLVFNDTIYLHWTRDEMSGPDPMSGFLEPNPEEIASLIRAHQNGSPYFGLEKAEERNLYYCMSLSGNGARIVVRDWLELTVKALKDNMSHWFEDISIIAPDGSGPKRDFKLWALLYSMVREGIDELPPPLPGQIIRCALAGRQLDMPQTALAAALHRQIIECRKPEDKSDPKLNPARMALIKCCLLRSPNRKPTDTMTTELDPNSKDVAYRCGQLFAVIGRLQLLALGKVGASIADRTYGGVATHPATTLGPIFTKLVPYFKKANSRFPGSGTNKQKEIEVLATVIEQLGGLPKTLALEEQGRFALGYYCQLAQYRTDKLEADAAKAAEELADEEA